MAVSIGRLVAQNWSTTPRTVTILFLVVFAAISALFVVASEHDYRAKIYMRDHGVKAFGVVTRRYVGSRNGHYIDYKYAPVDPSHTSAKEMFSAYHEVSRENYRRYDIGSSIPIKYDPRNVTNSHLDVQGYWSDSRLALSGVLMFILVDVQIGAIVVAFWLLAGAVYRMFFAPAKDDAGSVNGAAA